MVDQSEETAVVVAAALVDSLRRSVAAKVAAAYRAGASPARMLAVVRESLADDRISLAYPELPAELVESRRAVAGELMELMEAAGRGEGIVLPVPDRRQDSSYSCGPAALEAIASYFGIEVDEATLRRLAETDPAEGTEADDLTRAARELGLTAKLISGMDLEDIAAAIAADRPVIVGMQAYGTPAEENAGEAGHYEVAIGYNPEKQTVTLQDPARDPEAGRTEMPAAEFMEKWKLAGRGGQMVERLGIIIGAGTAASGDDAVGRKIAKLRGEGKSAAQSAAIAYSMDRQGKL